MANRIVLSRAQDPLGLTRAQMEADPRGADPAARTFDTRKSMDQSQASLVYEHYLGDAHSLQLTAYSGQRGTLQFQSIPVATQASPLHPGGVIDLARVNDRNTDAAAGHGVVAAYAGYAVQRAGWEVEGFVRVDNLLDKAYAGSVIVNDGNGRFFEPASGQRWSTGLATTLRF